MNKRILLTAVILLSVLNAHSQTFNWNGFTTTTNSSTRTFTNGNMTAVVSAVTGGGVTGYSYGSNSAIGGLGVCAGTPNGLFLEMSGASVAWNNSINVAITFATPVCSPVTFTIYDINEDVWNDGTTNWSNYCDQVTIGATDPSATAIAPANITYGGCAVAGNVTTAGNNKTLRGRWTNNLCNCSTANITINGGGQLIKTINVLYNNTQPPTYGKYGVAQFQNIVISPVVATAAPTASINHSSIPCGTNSTTLTAVTNATSPTYSWTGSAGTNISSPTAASTLVTGAGTYTLTVTNGGGGCSATAIYTLTVSSAPNVSVTSSTNILCNGGNNGSATVTVSGGTPSYTYSWSPPGGTGATATGLTAGTYTCTVTDAAGCSASQLVVINQPNLLQAAVTSVNVDCYGHASGTATVTGSGGTGAYAYSWNTVPPQTSYLATGLSVGTYTVTLTDGNGCSTTQTAVITQPDSLYVTFNTTNATCSSCFDGTGTAFGQSGTPPYNYEWNTSPQQTTQTATGLSPGNYIACAYDANKCQSCVPVTITWSVGLNESTDASDGIYVYPNPSTGIFILQIQNRNLKINKVEITDVTGRIVAGKENPAFYPIKFNLDKIASGLYVIKIYSEDKFILKKILVE